MQALSFSSNDTRSQDLESASSSPNNRYQNKQSAKHQPDQSGETLYESEPRSTKVKVRIAVFCSCLVLLIIGRANIPSEVTYDPIDRVQDLFLKLNEYVMQNPPIRDALLIICSLFMDLMFLATAINWVLRGGSCRLIVSIVSFYLIRGAVQAVWVSPFPKEGIYWWYDPGFPSLVVPYGLGTDFFFSGHIGFVTICALEWRAVGNKLMTVLLTIGGVYTGIILLLYRVHYSIDIFVGVTFAHYMFIIVNHYKNELDAFFIKIYFACIDFVARSRNTYKKPQETEQMLG